MHKPLGPLGWLAVVVVVVLTPVIVVQLYRLDHSRRPKPKPTYAYPAYTVGRCEGDYLASRWEWLRDPVTGYVVLCGQPPAPTDIDGDHDGEGGGNFTSPNPGSPYNP